MVCQYCNKRLGFIQRMKGLQYCSLEHQELHFGVSFERLRGSLTESIPDKPKLEWPKAKPEQAQAEPQQSQANTVEPPAGSEQQQQQQPQEVELEPPQTEPAVEPEAQDASPTLEIASLGGAVGTSIRADLPEAPFLLAELPTRQDQPASPLKTYAAELAPAPLQMPVNPTQKFPLQAAPTLVLDISPAEPQVDATPVAGRATWRPVPDGYPPVIASDSATLLLDSSLAEMIPMGVGQPCRGTGPVPLPQPVAIETPSRQPRLPSRHPVHFLAPRFVRPPQAAACRSSWEGRQGAGPKLPPITGILRPQRDVVRLVPPARQGHVGGLSSFPFFAEEPRIPVPPDEPRVATGSPIEATIPPRRTMWGTKEAFTVRALALGRASRTLAVDSPKPLRGEPSSAEILASWAPPAVSSQLPRTAIVPPSVPIGLVLAAEAIPLVRASVTSLPPAAETEPEVTNAVPFRILSRLSSLSAPAMPSRSTTLPLQREACRLPAPISEQECIQRAAYLHPSLPSPMSLLTWSRSLSVSIPARNPSNPGVPAPIGLRANPGRVPAFRLWSPSRRGHSLTPLLPLPQALPWAPAAPMRASLRPPVIQPIRPGSEGTAPPSLITVRVQPASMPALPPPSTSARIDSATGLAISGSSPEDALQLTCTDMAHRTSRLISDVRVESHAVLPSFLAAHHSPAIGLALSGHNLRWSATPSIPAVSPVQPFSAQKRLASSLTTRLPGPAG